MERTPVVGRLLDLDPGYDLDEDLNPWDLDLDLDVDLGLDPGVGGGASVDPNAGLDLQLSREPLRDQPRRQQLLSQQQRYGRPHGRRTVSSHDFLLQYAAQVQEAEAAAAAKAKRRRPKRKRKTEEAAETASSVEHVAAAAEGPGADGGSAATEADGSEAGTQGDSDGGEDGTGGGATDGPGGGAGRPGGGLKRGGAAVAAAEAAAAADSSADALPPGRAFRHAAAAAAAAAFPSRVGPPTAAEKAAFWHAVCDIAGEPTPQELELLGSEREQLRAWGKVDVRKLSRESEESWAGIGHIVEAFGGVPMLICVRQPVAYGAAEVYAIPDLGLGPMDERTWAAWGALDLGPDLGPDFHPHPQRAAPRSGSGSGSRPATARPLQPLVRIPAEFEVGFELCPDHWRGEGGWRSYEVVIGAGYAHGSPSNAWSASLHPLRLTCGDGRLRVNARHVYDLIGFIEDPDRDEIEAHVTNIALLQRFRAARVRPKKPSAAAAEAAASAAASAAAVDLAGEGGAGGAKGKRGGSGGGSGKAGKATTARSAPRKAAAVKPAPSSASANLDLEIDLDVDLDGELAEEEQDPAVLAAAAAAHLKQLLSAGVAPSSKRRGASWMLSPWMCHWLLTSRYGARGLEAVGWGAGDTLRAVRRARGSPVEAAAVAAAEARSWRSAAEAAAAAAAAAEAEAEQAEVEGVAGRGGAGRAASSAVVDAGAREEVEVFGVGWTDGLGGPSEGDLAGDATAADAASQAAAAVPAPAEAPSPSPVAAAAAAVQAPAEPQPGSRASSLLRWRRQSSSSLVTVPGVRPPPPRPPPTAPARPVQAAPPRPPPAAPSARPVQVRAAARPQRSGALARAGAPAPSLPAASQPPAPVKAPPPGSAAAPPAPVPDPAPEPGSRVAALRAWAGRPLGVVAGAAAQDPAGRAAGKEGAGQGAPAAGERTQGGAQEGQQQG
ncbi:hypothetical protein HYH03_001797 [Edaphochlamys debaryana]|uniref:Uncharacterized protein n=1 Tax=Edaphochlamys debaryana TaxID=47281 RepID=A0A835YED9_9CHLO|nr:hypothetical protein HYH03_001797 [Edaphochlamys debaryana]|eukprot:KAG2500219.1 hypothetical protein HYH03_001797 [Edaphochlamys debaryana]